MAIVCNALIQADILKAVCGKLIVAPIEVNIAAYPLTTVQRYD